MTFLNIDDIDKTIFELIRKELVSLGLLPDILTSTDYDLAKQALKGSLKNGIIEVFGVASWQDRDMKRLSRFVIDRTDIKRGQFGGGGIVDEAVIENGQAVINQYKVPSSKNITYEIRFSTNTQAYELVSNDVISKLFGQNSNKLCLSERAGTSELSFNIAFNGSYNSSNYGFHERIFTLEVKNVILENEVIDIVGTHVPISVIDLKIKNQNIEVAHIQS